MTWWLLPTLVLAANPPAPSAAGAAKAGTILGSKHDLTPRGPGPVRSVSEDEVCKFCHVPHGASLKDKHLSGRPDVDTTARRGYESSTLSNRPKRVGGVSRVCLTCHDGSIALGQTLRGRIAMRGTSGGDFLPSDRPSNLGTDLRRSHPVSMSGSAGARAHKPARGARVALDESGSVQCTSCHDAHSQWGGAPEEGNFLRMPTASSELCAQCHPVVSDSGHATSTRKFGTAEGNLRGYATVGTAGCGACHRSHGADLRGRLLARGDKDGNDVLCVRCHGGTASRVSIAADLAKPFPHGELGPDVHDAEEGPASAAHRLPETSASAARHSACVDCHEPHFANGTAAKAPVASGRLAGVWGIDISGRRVERVAYEYEVCLKCHGDSVNLPRTPTSAATALAPRRAAADRNLRRVFSPGSPSSHPVAGPGRNGAVPSLLAPLTPTSQIYCGDCHASDTGPGTGGAGARGPHGSIYPWILERNYSTADLTPESAVAYALCYKCHDRARLLDPLVSTFPLHRTHVTGQKANAGAARGSPTPCSVCHASHGVSSVLGTAANNAHLIDFDLNVVKPLKGAPPRYDAGGASGGSCSLECHGHRHDASRY